MTLSPRIEPHDQEDLRWYFRDGLKRLERPSNMQQQLDRLSLYYHRARPCQRCGGDAQSGTSGTGFVPGKPTVEIDPKTRLPKYGCSPGRAPTSDEVEHLATLDIPPPIGEGLCPKCKGRGWVEGRRGSGNDPQTARPTGSSKKGGGSASSDEGAESLARLGKVSRRLGDVEQASWVARAVLEAYYAPDGGDLGALWHLTPAGKTMMRDNPQGLPRQQLFANIRAQQAEKPKDGRRQQFEAAGEQARELLNHAIETWIAIVGTKPASELDDLEVVA
jgi:hypothetical protein